MFCKQSFYSIHIPLLRLTGWRALTTFNNLRDLRLVGVKFERRQEAQGAQVEGHNWWNALLQMKKGKTGWLCQTSGYKNPHHF